MRTIIFILYCTICFQGISQNDSLKLKGTLFYFGDFFVFYPKVKHKCNIVKTLNRAKKSNGINLLEICIPEQKAFSKAFESIIVDSSENDTKWKYLYVANVEVIYKNVNRTKNGFDVRFEFVYEDENCKIQNSEVIKKPRIITFSNLSDGVLMYNELEITPPDVLINCE